MAMPAPYDQSPRATFADVEPGDLFEHIAEYDYNETIATVTAEGVTLSNGSVHAMENYGDWWQAWPAEDDAWADKLNASLDALTAALMAGDTDAIVAMAPGYTPDWEAQ
jgi:hypothetical protein